MNKVKKFLNILLLILSFCIFILILFKGNETQMKYSFYALVSMILLSISHKLKILEYGKLKVELTEKIQEANEIIDIMNEYMKSLLKISYRSASNSGRYIDPEDEVLFSTEILDELLKKTDNEKDPQILEIRNRAFYLIITDGVRNDGLTKHLFDPYVINKRYDKIPHPDELERILEEHSDGDRLISNYRDKYNKYIDEIK